MTLLKKIIVKPSTVSGSIFAPASKSSMQRAVAAALIRKGISIIKNPGISNDDKASFNVIKKLGAIVNQNNDGSLLINSTNALPEEDLEINFGESGLGIRMFTPIAAINKKSTFINGHGSLLKRPMRFFDEILPKLNVQVESNNGMLPLKISGGLIPRNIEIDGSLSSQFLTGLLYAYSALATSDVTIKVKNLNSKPYIDLTLQVLKDFHLKVPENKAYEYFYFNKENFIKNKSIVEYTVEGDWSGGAFLLVMGAIAGEIRVKSLNTFSTQADKKILEALIDCGAEISIKPDYIFVKKSKLKAFHFDATDCPDLFPPLVALASFCEGTSVIRGVQRLTHKESDRSITLQEEFAKLGVNIQLQDDLMLIDGIEQTNSCTVNSHNDHRIAMACAVAALNANGNVIIEDYLAVNKSYPNFFDDLFKLTKK